MKIVLLSNKKSTGFEILKSLKESGIVIDSIIIEETLPPKKSFIIKKYLRSVAPDFIINFLRKIRNLEPLHNWEKNSSYNIFSKNIFFVENFNSKITEEILKNITPDIIILGGSRIIKKNIIEIPKIGILNAHPGLLPKYRGVDVIPRAILNGDEIGVTIHFINEGIDTGAICRKEIIVIEKNDSIKSLRKKAEKKSAILMKDVVAEIIQYGSIITSENPKEDGKQYFKMNEELLHQAEDKLKCLINEKYGQFYN